MTLNLNCAIVRKLYIFLHLLILKHEKRVETDQFTIIRNSAVCTKTKRIFRLKTKNAMGPSYKLYYKMPTIYELPSASGIY